MRTRSRAGLGALSHLKHRHPRQLIVRELASHQLEGRVVPRLAPPRRRARVARSALLLGFQRPRPDTRLLAAPPSSEALRLEPLPGRRLSVSLEPGLDVARQSLTLLARLHRPRGSPAPPPRDSRAQPVATSLCCRSLFFLPKRRVRVRKMRDRWFRIKVNDWEPALSHRRQFGGSLAVPSFLTSSPLSPFRRATR